MSQVLLDTHVWIWWSIGADQALSPKAREVLAASKKWVSAISCWELAKLVEKKPPGPGYPPACLDQSDHSGKAVSGWQN